MSDNESRKSGGSGSEPEEDYEVEEIRDKQRADDGSWLYYVKWVGWESDTNTWEPKEHLQDCREKFVEFEAKWRRKQERKEERRKEERERKIKERRERELKAAARFGRVDSDSDGGGGYERSSIESRKEKKKERKVSSSDSESDAERKKRQREKLKKHKKDKDRRRDRSVENDKKKEEPKKEIKPKYFRDIKPDKILGVTAEPGELYFYIKWQDDKIEPGLVTAKEAYQKIPLMCLKFYEKQLVWNKNTKPSKPTETTNDSVKKETEINDAVTVTGDASKAKPGSRRESVESRSSERDRNERKENTEGKFERNEAEASGAAIETAAT